MPNSFQEGHRPDWRTTSRAGTHSINPEPPWQNAWIESFIARLRDECLTVEDFTRLLGAQIVIVDWCRDDNSRCSHRTRTNNRGSPGRRRNGPDYGREAPGRLKNIVSISERTTWFASLVQLPTDRKAHTVRGAIASKSVEHPEQFRRSLTSDRGKEMAEHGSFRVAPHIAVYFCHPHSPWQRGTNELGEHSAG